MRTGQSRKDGSGAVKFVKPVLTGTAAGGFCAALALTLFSLLLSLRDISQMAVEPMALAAIALGALAGGFVSAKLSGERGLFAGFFSGLLLFVLLMLSSLLIFGGELSGGTLPRLLCSLLPGALGGALGVRTRGRRK